MATYMRHGSEVRLEKRECWSADYDMIPRSKFVTWLVWVNGKVRDRALAYRVARKHAERLTRQTLLRGATP